MLRELQRRHGNRALDDHHCHWLAGAAASRPRSWLPVPRFGQVLGLVNRLCLPNLSQFYSVFYKIK
jgi:hypothetical protein